MTQVLLVRHCDATGQGPGAPLSPSGEQQAKALAAKLVGLPVDYIVASPYLRARRTASPLAASLGLPVHSDARLVEHRLSSAPVPEWRDFVERAFSEPHARAPGGDAPAETLARAIAALEDVIASGRTLPVLVTHGLLLSLLLHSIDPGFGFDGWKSLRNPDVFRLVGPLHQMRFERIELS
ncbi:MAG: histidine phosphatase family protein [Proteobacteria bacterium]|nr:MAG: histidine phosphatase family protein [Pseudomonadota bacterium]